MYSAADGSGDGRDRLVVKTHTEDSQLTTTHSDPVRESSHLLWLWSVVSGFPPMPVWFGRAVWGRYPCEGPSKSRVFLGAHSAFQRKEVSGRNGHNGHCPLPIAHYHLRRHGFRNKSQVARTKARRSRWLRNHATTCPCAGTEYRKLHLLSRDSDALRRRRLPFSLSPSSSYHKVSFDLPPFLSLQPDLQSAVCCLPSAVFIFFFVAHKFGFPLLSTVLFDSLQPSSSLSFTSTTSHFQYLSRLPTVPTTNVTLGCRLVATLRPTLPRTASYGRDLRITLLLTSPPRG